MNDSVFLIIICFFVAISFFCVGNEVGQNVIKQEAIDHGAAQFDVKTGLWHWIERDE